MPTLLEIQRALGAALLGSQALDPDGSDRQAPAQGTHSPPADILESLDPLGLSVYRNTCRHTLTKALSATFPVVERLVGAEFFAGMAHEFIERHLPASACLDDYGGELPAFIGTFAPAASLPYLADVAQLEWAVNQALHAPDVDALDLTRLSGLDESTLAALRFTMHPSVTLLSLRFPADAIWDAVVRRDEAAMAAIDPGSGPVYLLIERDGDGVRVRRQREDAWRFTRRLAAGLPLEHALRTDGEGLTTPTSLDALHAVLADHFASGRLASASPVPFNPAPESDR